jgi:HSP20 family protein
MSLAKWEPMQELVRLRDEMDRIFGRSIEGSFAGDGQTWIPSVDVREENGNLVVKADLPGVKKEDVSITATEDALTIQGKNLEEKEEKKEGYYRRERRSGSFARTLSLPVAVDADKAQASFQDGTITITLPKTKQAAKAKKVAIK